MERNILNLREQIDFLIETKNLSKAREILEDTPAVDIAEFLSGLEISNSLPLFRIIPKELAADVFSYMDSDIQHQFISSITDEEISKLVELISLDDAVDMAQELPATVVKRILKNTSAGTRKLINTFLNYTDDTVGSIMTSEFTDLKANMSVKESIDYVRSVGQQKETIYTCYVIGKSRELLGSVELFDILSCSDDFMQISSLMNTNLIKVCTTDDKENAARLIKKYDLTCLPVVDLENRLVGIVTVDDIVDVLEEETTKDIEQMSAISPTETPYLKTTTFKLVASRLPWLFILMIAGMINGSILGKFEGAISSVPLLVTFLPMLTGTGGNSGSQSTTTVIRNLVTGEITTHDLFKTLWKELRVAFCIGLCLGGFNFLRVILFESDPDKIMIATIVSVSLIATIVIAKSLGAILPILAKKTHLDPAVIAAPMITTLVDAFAITVYFVLAISLLSYRL